MDKHEIFDSLRESTAAALDGGIQLACALYGGIYYHSGGGIMLGLFADGDGLTVLDEWGLCYYSTGGGEPEELWDLVGAEGYDPLHVHDFEGARA